MPSQPTSETVGKPAVLWQLKHRSEGIAECLSAETTAHQVRVWVVRRGAEDVSGTFPTVKQAIEWAMEQRSHVERGWAKTA